MYVRSTSHKRCKREAERFAIYGLIGLDLPGSRPLIILERSKLMSLVISTLSQCSFRVGSSVSLGVEFEFLLVGGRGEWESLFIDHPQGH